ncbi:MAG: hypothetical protein Q7R79_01110 [bacterium]|nr:hypothetical protein [bacterium]
MTVKGVVLFFVLVFCLGVLIAASYSLGRYDWQNNVIPSPRPTLAMTSKKMAASGEALTLATAETQELLTTLQDQRLRQRMLTIRNRLQEKYGKPVRTELWERNAGYPFRVPNYQMFVQETTSASSSVIAERQLLSLDAVIRTWSGKRDIECVLYDPFAFDIVSEELQVAAEEIGAESVTIFRQEVSQVSSASLPLEKMQ